MSPIIFKIALAYLMNYGILQIDTKYPHISRLYTFEIFYVVNFCQFYDINSWVMAIAK